MPPMVNSRHERFAVLVASGKTATQAYIDAGYSEKGARFNASHLTTNHNVALRIAELQAQTTAVAIADTIFDKQCRVRAQEDRWERMKRVIAERAADPEMATVPGGPTGLLVRQVKKIGSGKDAELVYEYAVDGVLLREMRAHEEAAAIELGQIAPKGDGSGGSAKVLIGIRVEYV